MNIRHALSIKDLQDMSRRFLPRVIADLVDSGVDDEHIVQRNRDGFAQHLMVPRSMVDVRERSQKKTLFGQTYDSSFGVAPTGIAGLVRAGADFHITRAARSAGIPYILSGASMSSLDEVYKAAEGNLWFQPYPARNRDITFDQMRRAEALGVSTLVLTVDSSALPNRETDTRNGFSMPLKIRPRLVADALLHPWWTLQYFAAGGLPKMGTWTAYANEGASAVDIASFVWSQHPSGLVWDEFGKFRENWKGELVVKGVLHPGDAVRFVDQGADGVIVSNHGGKVFDPAPSSIAALPAIVAAVGGRVPVMMDGGIRRGSDVLVARCLGAEFVFTGRAMLWGVAAGGEAGVDHAIRILKREIDLSLALVGCPNIDELDDTYLFERR